ncbi:type II toxin-antitoxin system RelE/ParE family toxin [Leptolyngbya sp. AN03gr2]|uniref:type II toxin-antitoxin system RelE/ParE family toxin n=1 Tax=unclassified Leptolyngbya TaxID=2650499 RepID=UPI003D315A62
MSQVTWLEQALSDIQRHIEALQQSSPDAVSEFADVIITAGNSLATFPKRYPVVRQNSVIRRMPVPFGKYGYCLYYVVSDDDVLVLQVMHGRELSPY